MPPRLQMVTIHNQIPEEVMELMLTIPMQTVAGEVVEVVIGAHILREDTEAGEAVLASCGIERLY